MKKLRGSVKGLVVMLVITLCGVLTGCSGEDKEVLRIYNAGEYIDESLIGKFEKENNCKVVYSTFDSNESMYTMLNSGEKYDILVPSDYMIERLIKEEYLKKIDWSKITIKDTLLEDVMDKEYDPGNKYSVPYYWGNVGILYNKKTVDKKDLKDGWELLNNKKYKGKLYMYNSERDSFMIALKALGYSMNTDSKKELDKAYDWLVKQNKKMKPVYAGDEVIDNMISGNKEIAIVYSGDGALIISENPELDFYVPKQGTNVWVDAMVLTKDCKNDDLAYKFMNFILEKENALINTEYIGYSSSVKSVYEEMQKTTYKGIDAYVVDDSNKKNEVFRYQSTETKKYMSELWTKVIAQ
ncbi:MAG: ABC transporter substrate-binding protein [Lachnospiraceae bacterium]|nr:ABC transporter substrate-binding protein [Lachnospiraceae bacterium]